MLQKLEDPCLLCSYDVGGFDMWQVNNDGIIEGNERKTLVDDAGLHDDDDDWIQYTRRTNNIEMSGDIGRSNLPKGRELEEAC